MKAKGSTSKENTCLLCGSKLGLMQRISKQDFCCSAHRVQFHKIDEDLALQRLDESTNKVPPAMVLEREPLKSAEGVVLGQQIEKEAEPKLPVEPVAEPVPAVAEMADAAMAGFILEAVDIRDVEPVLRPPATFLATEVAARYPSGVSLQTGDGDRAEDSRMAIPGYSETGIQSIPLPRTEAIALHLEPRRRRGEPVQAQPVKLDSETAPLLSDGLRERMRGADGVFAPLAILELENHIDATIWLPPMQCSASVPELRMRFHSAPMTMSTARPSAKPVLRPVACTFSAAGRAR